MVKSVIKEIIIILLLLLAVILALGIIFYDYIPSNKAVPSVSSYNTSESVKKEITEPVAEDEPILVTYEITDNDLKSLEKTKEYNKGKANPFSTYEDPEPANGETNNVNSVNSINTNVNKAGSNTGTNNTFYKNNTGTK